MITVPFQCCFSMQYTALIILLLFAVSCSSSQELSSSDFNPDDYYNPYSNQVKSLVDKELEKAGLNQQKETSGSPKFYFC